MSILVTGVAGFIGFHVAKKLLDSGMPVVGIDNLNDYYSVELKRARIKALQQHDNGFKFVQTDISDASALNQNLSDHGFKTIIHLAAQAGVRNSIDDPLKYGQSNLSGHLNMLEFARHHEPLERMVYASSSSVYGGNRKVPFSEDDPVNNQVSLYAATKRADELMSGVYSHLYGLRLIGLRFFTVYGPWGRPDMALWKFTKAILDERPIQVFNHGDMRRDFTYIDDIVSGVIATALQKPATGNDLGHSLYNIGNNQPEQLMDLIEMLQDALGTKAKMEMLPMQPGDVYETYADISAISRDYGFVPTTSLQQGIEKFVEWFRSEKALHYD